MTDTIRDLLISLASHMAYMQGQLEAHHPLDDPEDYYWYRESVLLRQKVTDALADEPAVPEGREPASVTGQPSDQEIMELMPQQMHEDLADAVRAMAEQKGIDSTAAKGVMRIMLNRHVVDLARAVLTRWGNPAPQPLADGEVAKLVARLLDMQTVPTLEERRLAADLLQHLSPPQPLADGEVGKPVAWMCPAEPYFDGNKWHDQWQVTLDQRLAEYWARPGKPTPLFTRAAELLQRETLVPVSVSERLPRPKDCDAEGRCWWFALETEVDFGAWTLGTPEACTGDNWGHTHWLPAHALPLPKVDQ